MCGKIYITVMSLSINILIYIALEPHPTLLCHQILNETDCDWCMGTVQLLYMCSVAVLLCSLMLVSMTLHNRQRVRLTDQPTGLYGWFQGVK